MFFLLFLDQFRASAATSIANQFLSVVLSLCLFVGVHRLRKCVWISVASGCVLCIGSHAVAKLSLCVVLSLCSF